MNSPKSTPRLSITRSQPNKSRITRFQSPRQQHSHHSSLVKNAKIPYTKILNRLLSITNYHKFISLASKFVDRQILQCKQQIHRNMSFKNKPMFQYFVTDGVFVKKLAEISGNSKAVLDHFMPHVKMNKKVLKDYQRGLEHENQNWQSSQIGYNVNGNNESEEDREARLYGYSKSKKKNEEQNKIHFEQYIKSNRKSMQIYEQVKKKLQQQKNQQSKNKKGDDTNKKILKRNSISQSGILIEQKYKIIGELRKNIQQLNLLLSLSELEREIVLKFPKIDNLIVGTHCASNLHVICQMGVWRKCRIVMVLVEVDRIQGDEIIQYDGRCQQAIALIQQGSTGIQDGNSCGKDELIDHIEVDEHIRYLYKKVDKL